MELFRKGEDNGLFNNNDFLFVDLITLGTFIEFWLVGSLSSVFKSFNN